MEKSKSTRNNTLRMLTEAAVFIAAAQILSYIKLWQMPYGGSVCLAMLPILFFAVRWGLGPGLLAGFVFGILQFVFDGGFAFGWQSMIGDYLIVAVSDKVLFQEYEDGVLYPRFKGMHGGLAQDEMMVPLILIPCE